jgi:(R,R)-butanediol dehydrogenase/meso-butanediol dehydrogenase/diacetyl reductase
MLYSLADHVSFEAATLADPLASSLHGIGRSNLKTGDRVVVIGAGPIGLGVIQLLKMSGFEDIIVLEVSPQRSTIALQLGASIVLDPTNDPTGMIEKIFQLTGGLGADIVFECAGVPEALQHSIHYVRKGGQVMVVGITEHDTPINPLAFVLAEVNMKGCLGYTTHEFQTVIRLLEQKKINTDMFITEAIGLIDIEEKGFKRLINSSDAVKIIVRPE